MMLNKIAGIGFGISLLVIPLFASAQSAKCVALSYSFGLGSSDPTTGGEVSALQKFLVAQGYTIYPEARVSGYFGPATERAVKRYQAARGLISYGSPSTTGYGYIGRKTRAAIGGECGGTAANAIAATPSIIANAVTPDSITAAYANLPANSQIVLVDFYTNLRYNAQSTMVVSGGSGSVVIPIPADIRAKPGSLYYLRVINYYNPSVTLAQSERFQASGFAANAPSCSITSEKSIVAIGQPFTITWSSQNALYAVGSVGFPVNDPQRPASGSMQLTALTAGAHVYAMVFQGGSGSQSICSVNVVATAAQLTPSITLYSPTQGSQYRIGDQIPIAWSYANAPSNAQVTLSLKNIQAGYPPSGTLSGGSWQQTSGTAPGSGSGAYNWPTGASLLDYAGTYELVATISECDPHGCAFNYGAPIKVYATSQAIRFTIGNASAPQPVYTPAVQTSYSSDLSAYPYVTPKGLTTIRPPSGWSALPLLDFPENMLATVVFYKTLDGPAAMNWTVAPRPSSYAIDSYMTKASSNFALEGGTLTNIYKQSIAGREGFVMEGTKVKTGDLLRTKMWVVVGDTRVYVLVAVAKDNEWNTFASLFEQVAGTLQVQ